MKVGDKLVCKKDKWEVIDWYPDGDEKYGWTILKGKYYVVTERIERMDLVGCLWGISSEIDVVPGQIYSETEIEEYFYSDKELRKLKLDNLRAKLIEGEQSGFYEGSREDLLKEIKSRYEI